MFAPHSQLRAAVTPAHRGIGAAQQPPADPAQPPTPRQVALSWARRLKRVFGIEIEGGVRCGGALRIIASIEEPQDIELENWAIALAADAPGSPGRRAYREWAGDGRLRLTPKRVTRIASAWEGGLKFLSAESQPINGNRVAVSDRKENSHAK